MSVYYHRFNHTTGGWTSSDDITSGVIRTQVSISNLSVDGNATITVTKQKFIDLGYTLTANPANRDRFTIGQDTKCLLFVVNEVDDSNPGFYIIKGQIGYSIYKEIQSVTILPTPPNTTVRLDLLLNTVAGEGGATGTYVDASDTLLTSYDCTSYSIYDNLKNICDGYGLWLVHGHTSLTSYAPQCNVIKNGVSPYVTDGSPSGYPKTISRSNGNLLYAKWNKDDTTVINKCTIIGKNADGTAFSETYTDTASVNAYGVREQIYSYSEVSSSADALAIATGIVTLNKDAVQYCDTKIKLQSDGTIDRWWIYPFYGNFYITDEINGRTAVKLFLLEARYDSRNGYWEMKFGQTQESFASQVQEQGMRIKNLQKGINQDLKTSADVIFQGLTINGDSTFRGDVNITDSGALLMDGSVAIDGSKNITVNNITASSATISGAVQVSSLKIPSSTTTNAYIGSYGSYKTMRSSFHYYVYDSQGSANTDMYIGTVSGRTRVAQKKTLTVTNLDAITLRFKNNGSTGNVYYRIRRVSDDVALIEKNMGDASLYNTLNNYTWTFSYSELATISGVSCYVSIEHTSTNGQDIKVSCYASGADIKGGESLWTYAPSTWTEATGGLYWDLWYVLYYTDVTDRNTRVIQTKTINGTPTQIGFKLKYEITNGSKDIYVRVRKASDDSIYLSKKLINSSVLTGTSTLYTVDLSEAESYNIPNVACYICCELDDGEVWGVLAEYSSSSIDSGGNMKTYSMNSLSYTDNAPADLAYTLSYIPAYTEVVESDGDINCKNIVAASSCYLPSTYITSIRSLDTSSLDATVQVAQNGTNNVWLRHRISGSSQLAGVLFSNYDANHYFENCIGSALYLRYNTTIDYAGATSLMSVGTTGNLDLITGGLYTGSTLRLSNTGALSNITTVGCGAITSSGALALGTNTITCGAITTSGNLIPNGASTLNLGSTTAEWANLYIGTGKLYLGATQECNLYNSSGTLTTDNAFSCGAITSTGAISGDRIDLTDAGGQIRSASVIGFNILDGSAFQGIKTDEITIDSGGTYDAVLSSQGADGRLLIESGFGTTTIGMGSAVYTHLATDGTGGFAFNNHIILYNSNTYDIGSTGPYYVRNLYMGTGIYMGGTQIVNSSRQLLNIDTIGCGAITSTGAVQGTSLVSSSGGCNIPTGQTYNINSSPHTHAYVSRLGTTVDNTLCRWNGGSADSIQESNILVDDSENVSGIGTLASTTHSISSTSWIIGSYYSSTTTIGSTLTYCNLTVAHGAGTVTNSQYLQIPTTGWYLVSANLAATSYLDSNTLTTYVYWSSDSSGTNNTMIAEWSTGSGDASTLVSAGGAHVLYLYAGYVRLAGISTTSTTIGTGVQATATIPQRIYSGITVLMLNNYTVAYPGG